MKQTPLFEIREIQEKDRAEVFSMMRSFYDSPAVITKSSNDILQRDISDCISNNPLIDGFVFQDKETEEILGYSMLAHSYSTEFGGECIWIEDLYIKEQFRGLGIGKCFFDFVNCNYGNNAVRFRLEAELDNENAIRLYKKCGYDIIPYVQLSKENV